MGRTLIGIVTFGNLEFTKLTAQSIRETTKAEIDFCIVVGKPDDEETRKYFTESYTPKFLIEHEKNNGFPVCINDIYDAAWKGENYDNVVIAGNDIVPYPGAIDLLIELAAKSDWEWLCSTQFDSRSLVAHYPAEAGKYFSGPGMMFTEFAARPWDLHAAHVAATPFSLEPHAFKDVRNLTLFKRSVFEKIGYADASFYPGGYFEDNDYARRAVNAELKGCGVPQSVYFHFWSRTIHQGGSGQTRDEKDEKDANLTAGQRDRYFQQNEAFYRLKWGGPFGCEAWKVPFNGGAFNIGGAMLRGDLKIDSRDNEEALIAYWRAK